MTVLGVMAARFNPFPDKEFALRFLTFFFFLFFRETATKKKFSKPEMFSHLLFTRCTKSLNLHKKSEFKQDVM